MEPISSQAASISPGAFVRVPLKTRWSRKWAVPLPSDGSLDEPARIQRSIATSGASRCSRVTTFSPLSNLKERAPASGDSVWGNAAAPMPRRRIGRQVSRHEWFWRVIIYGQVRRKVIGREGVPSAQLVIGIRDRKDSKSRAVNPPLKRTLPFDTHRRFLIYSLVLRR